MAQYLQDVHTDNASRKKVTLTALQKMVADGEKITMLTCYDSSFAALMDRCGVDMLLVGDSVGMVCQGHDSTLPVTIEDIAYHTACVARGNQHAFIVADMPFASFATPEQTFQNAAKLIQSGAQMVKIEGGAWLAPTVKFLVERAIPVCAHLGLTPQSVHQLGGYKVQGKTPEAAQILKKDATELYDAGASFILLEAIPAALAREVSQDLRLPTIGIGAGVDCSGQVLVLQDMLGIFPGKKARFVKDFMQGQSSLEGAIKAFVQEVKAQCFPASEHGF